MGDSLNPASLCETLYPSLPFLRNCSCKKRIPRQLSLSIVTSTLLYFQRRDTCQKDMRNKTVLALTICEVVRVGTRRGVRHRMLPISRWSSMHHHARMSAVLGPRGMASIIGSRSMAAILGRCGLTAIHGPSLVILQKRTRNRGHFSCRSGSSLHPYLSSHEQHAGGRSCNYVADEATALQ